MLKSPLGNIQSLIIIIITCLHMDIAKNEDETALRHQFYGKATKPTWRNDRSSRFARTYSLKTSRNWEKAVN